MVIVKRKNITKVLKKIFGEDNLNTLYLEVEEVVPFRIEGKTKYLISYNTVEIDEDSNKKIYEEITRHWTSGGSSAGDIEGVLAAWLTPENVKMAKKTCSEAEVRDAILFELESKGLISWNSYDKADKIRTEIEKKLGIYSPLAEDEVA